MNTKERRVAGVDIAQQPLFTVVTMSGKPDAATVHSIYEFQDRNLLVNIASDDDLSLIFCDASGYGIVFVEEWQGHRLPVRPFSVTRRSKLPLFKSLVEASNSDWITFQDMHVGAITSGIEHAKMIVQKMEWGAKYEHNQRYVQIAYALALAYYALCNEGIRVNFVEDMS